MSTYRLETKEQAKKDLRRLLTDEPSSYKKAMKLIAEIIEHPRTGTGKPELLNGDKAGRWSRRITQKHRLIYEIHDDIVVVIVVAAYGHYDDK